MANSIAVQAYRVEFNTVTGLNYVTFSYPTVIQTTQVRQLFDVNTVHGINLPGLPYLYTKIVQLQPGLEQEIFVMNSILDIQNKLG
jgi:hypothetical protein